MKSVILSSLLLSAGLVQASVTSLSSVKRVTTLPIASSKFIVEVDSASNIPTKRSFRPQSGLYDTLSKRGIDYTVSGEFNNPLFYGSVITLSNADDVKHLQSVPGVVAVRPVTYFQRPTPVSVKAVTDKNDPSVIDNESTHIMTGVDKLRAEGITGKGIKVGIIDTGTDYTHPALGGGFGPGYKVFTGYDFVGDAYNGTAQSVPKPDNDPLDQCEGHGTHVAGIVGANKNPDFNITGVAPDALIASYRIFGCTGGVSDDIIVEALLRGQSDNMDILTLSLGGADGWTESTSSVIASRIAKTGKVVTIAAGNDGAYGSWYTSSPGNGLDVISVASVDNTVDTLQNATVSGVTHDPITYFSLFPLKEPGPFPIYATSNDTSIVDDACSPLPASTPDLSGYLVIVRRGSCAFTQKLGNIAAKGGKRAFIYNNQPGFAAIAVGNYSAVLIQPEDGAYLVSQFIQQTPIKIGFPQTGGSATVPDAHGGLVSTFTSYGPTNDMNFKPAIAAPGGNILSTYPVPLGKYAVLSGTSMATPFMAGSAALLLQFKGKTKAVALAARDLFETNAAYVGSSKTDSDPFQPVTQQGAGLVNVHQALHSSTIVTPGSFALNDTAHFNGKRTFTIKNVDNYVKHFTITHVPAGTAVTVGNSSLLGSPIFPNDGPVPISTQYATVSFSSTKITLRPGQTTSVTATFTPPAGVDKTTFPVYNGFIQIDCGGEIQHVTYHGLAASLKDKQVLDNTNAYFGINLPAFLDSTGNPQATATNYTFANSDYPSILYRLAFGTTSIQGDLVDATTNITTTYKRDLSRVNFPSFAKKPSGSFAAIKTVGNIFALKYQPRNSDAASASDNGYNVVAFDSGAVFANGTTIPNGQYRVLIRALRVTADPSSENSYESWISPVFGVAA